LADKKLRSQCLFKTNLENDGFSHEEIMVMNADAGRVSNRHFRVSNPSSNNEYKPK